MNIYQSDVVIIGAGPTGAHLAGLLGEAQISVILVDQQSHGKAGAQWINGAPEWMFHRAGLEKPLDNEIFSKDSVFTVLDPSSRYRVSIKDFKLLDIDMRHLGRRLAHNASNNRVVKLLFDTAITGIELDATGRPARAYAQTKNSDDPHICLKASLFVDASGLSSIVRKNVPELNNVCAPLARTDLCIAAQEVREIIDRHGAEKFLEANKACPGEILSWIGVAGGYSLMRVHVEHNLNHVAFLTGARALPNLPTGNKLIQKFVREQQDWIGRKMFGGQRALPLRRPYTELVAPGIALIGDSACQVYSMHGSGVGIGLVAAKMLADTIIKAAKASHDIGSTKSLWPYASGFHRQWGALLGISDLVRRVTQDFSPREVLEFMSSGLMSKGIMQDSLLQHHMLPRLHEIPSQLIAAITNRHVAKKASALLYKVPLIALNAQFYPRNRAGLSSYEERMRRLVDS